MFKVECEGCKAPFQVDERRVPAAGLKMRCPKCGASFLVRTPSASADDAGAALPALVTPGAGPLALAPATSSRAAELPAVAVPRASAARAASPPPAAAEEDVPSFELDLPAPAASLPEARSLAGPAPALPRPAPPAFRAGPPLPRPMPLAGVPVGAAAPPPARASTAADTPRKSDLPALFGGGLPAVRSNGPRPAASVTAPTKTLAAARQPSVGEPPPAFDAAEELAFDLPGVIEPALPSPGARAPVLALEPPPVGRPSEPAFGEIDLPLLTREHHMPATLGDLPRARGTSRPPSATARAGEAFALGSDPPPPPAGEPYGAWGEADELDDPSQLTGPSGAPLPGRSIAPEPDGAFGELSLPEAANDAPIGFDSVPPPESAPPSSRLDPPSEDDMEFGEIPQQKSEVDLLTPELAGSPRLPLRKVVVVPASAAPKSPKRARIAAGVLAVLVIAGASLEVVSPWGAFGRHAVLDLLNRDKLRALEASTIGEARSRLASDTFRQATEAIAGIDAAIAHSPRAVGLLPYDAFVGYSTELRYGRSPTIDAHAKQQLAQALERQPGPFVELARAAEAAVESQLPRAKQTADALAELEPQNIDVAILVAEVHFLSRDFDKALESWTRAASLDGGTARSVFGIARALSALDKDGPSIEQANKVLALSPTHVGARLLIAHAHWSGARDEPGTMAALTAVTSPGAVREAASALELVDALTLTALIHMSRSRMSPAEAALTQALAIDPKAASALAAMGEVLYLEGRFTDALARFDAGIQADPEGTAAKIGSAKTKIALERLAEAKEQLKKLSDARPNDAEVTYWVGRSEDALGDRAAATRAYQQAIATGGGKPQTVEAYVALSKLLSSEGHPAEAELQLAEAKARLPRTPSVHRALGDVHLVAGRYEAAQEEFEAAIALDPGDIASRFRLAGVARRMGNLERADQLLGKVAEEDPEYPGLALERGVLYEARNLNDEALRYYQQALSKAPDDADLMLRVGSSEVASGHAAQAEEILRKVVNKRPNSAEVNHFLGRALLLKGNNLAESLRYLKRAVDIDPNRAEYHLYVGWAANEVGQPALAQDELTRALELDKGLADAYWQEGVLQRKQGAVLDAVKNLKKALELRPSRYEAYATLAECYEDQNQTGEAIAAWRKAVASDPTRGEWHYRLGKLLGRAGESELRGAVDATENREPRPPWLAQAYFELADIERASGKREQAIGHYRKFLAFGKVDSPYRADAVKALSLLGAPYDPASP